MDDVKSIVLCLFLGYIFIHLLIDDIVFLYLHFRSKRSVVQPYAVVSNSLSSSSSVSDIETDQRSHYDQRSLVVIFFKLCDTVSRCVEGYFVCFTTCWKATLDCLEVMIVRYIDFLQYLVCTFTAVPTVYYLTVALAVTLSLTCLMIWILTPSHK